MLLLSWGVAFSACSDMNPEADAKTKIKWTAGNRSAIDGAPVLHMDGNTNAMGVYAASIHSRVATSIRTEAIAKASPNDGGLVALHESMPKAKGNTEEVISTHLFLEYGDKQEEFILTLQANTAMRKLATGSEAWLVLDPDRFLTFENPGNPWPLQTTAISLADPSNTAEITFLGNGEIESTQVKKENLIYITAVPVLEKPEPPVKAKNTASTQNQGIHVGVFRMQITDTRDGSGAAELQLFTNSSDDYAAAQFSKYYRRKFDAIYSTSCFCYTTDEQGSDEFNLYQTPDVNIAFTEYSFENMTYLTSAFGAWKEPSVLNQTLGTNYPLTLSGFPIEATSVSNQIPWRFIYIDDDRDYANFVRSSDQWQENIETYNLADNAWSNLWTKINTLRRNTGEDDDPILDSGIRRAQYDSFPFQIRKNVWKGPTFMWDLGIIYR